MNARLLLSSMTKLNRFPMKDVGNDRGETGFLPPANYLQGQAPTAGMTEGGEERFLPPANPMQGQAPTRRNDGGG